MFVIDRALRESPPRGTMISSDDLVDVLLELRLAVQEMKVLSSLDRDLHVAGRGGRRTGHEQGLAVTPRS
jgi:hypothetical protein